MLGCVIVSEKCVFESVSEWVGKIVSEWVDVIMSEWVGEIESKKWVVRIVSEG